MFVKGSCEYKDDLLFMGGKKEPIRTSKKVKKKKPVDIGVVSDIGSVNTFSTGFGDMDMQSKTIVA